MFDTYSKCIGSVSVNKRSGGPEWVDIKHKGTEITLHPDEALDLLYMLQRVAEHFTDAQYRRPNK